MALTLQTIFNFSETPFKLKLLAGKNGMNKPVSWIYYTEAADTIKYIRGGELAVTLGLNYERSKDNFGIESKNYLHEFLQMFIDNFIENDATGLIINTGKYIKEIPRTIINYCNEKNFPLFSMPWEIHTIDLMQDVGNMISSDSQNANSLEKYFYRAIFENDKFDPKQIENTSFSDAEKFSILLIDLNVDFFNNDIRAIKHYVQYKINAHLEIPQNMYSWFIHKQKIFYIIKNSNQIFTNGILKIICSDRYFKNSKIGLSDYTTDISELHEIYTHGKFALEINSSLGKINRYDDLGFYKILMAVKDKKILQQFYNEKLGKFDSMELDKKNDYLKTLSLYLKNGGNILKVAEQNNAHRNTILYRLNRMEELLQIDLSNGDVRTELQVALYIKDIL